MEKKIKVSLILVAIVIVIIGSILSYNAIKGEEKPVENKVGIIDLQGQLVSGEESDWGTTTGELQRALEKALREKHIKAVVLRIDSPGGAATSSYEMYSMVKSFDKPIVAYIRGTGASGSYLTALGAEKILAHPFSQLGSVGVYIQLRHPVPIVPENAKEIKIFSSGKFKTFWEDGVLDNEERSYIQMKIDELENTFQNIVYREAPIENPQKT